MASGSRRSAWSPSARLLFARVGVALLVLLAGSIARADDECSQSLAARLYADAHTAFEDKRFDDSVGLLRRAYACEANPVYLANIARAYEEASRPKDALAAWQAYLAVLTDARERNATQGRISALTKVVDDLERLEREKRAAEEAARQAEQKAQEQPPRPLGPETATSRVVPTPAWLVLGGGALGFAGGVVLGSLASAKHSSAQQQASITQAESMQDDAVNLSHAANWALAIGGTITAAALTWITVDLAASPKPAPVVDRLSFLVTAQGLGIMGTFR